MKMMLQMTVTGLCMALAVGCGGSTTAPVQGVVTLEGQPVYPARVTFSPKGAEGAVEAGGRVSSAMTDVDGTYSIEAAAIGENVVGVVLLADDEDSEEEEDNEQPAAVGKPAQQTYTVASGDNTIDVKLAPVAQKNASAGDDDDDDD